MECPEGECEDGWPQLAEAEPAALHAGPHAGWGGGTGEAGGLEWRATGRPLPCEPHAAAAAAVSAHDDGNAAAYAAAYDDGRRLSCAHDDATHGHGNAATPLHGQSNKISLDALR